MQVAPLRYGFMIENNNETSIIEYELRKSIYILKQVSRHWNIHFNETIKKFGFIKNTDEPCVYKKTYGCTIVFLVLYVDDISLEMMIQ